VFGVQGRERATTCGQSKKISFQLSFLEINLVGCCFSAGFQSTIVNPVVPYESICVQNGQKIFCNARKAVHIKAFERMNGDLTFYDLFASGRSG
jgi:hypothetical protein